MSAMQWMAQQVSNLPTPEQKSSPIARKRIGDVAEIVEYGKSRGIHLNAIEVGARFGISRDTAQKRLVEAASLGLVRRHKIGYRKADLFEVLP